MSNIPVLHWTIIALSPPQPKFHCSKCRTTQAFISSGKIRLNANGKSLDAWLIYRCSRCDNTWNRTIFERRNVGSIPSDELEALHHSDAAYVDRIAYDLSGLSNYITPENLHVNKEPLGLPVYGSFEIRITVPKILHIRLSQILAQELKVSRSALNKMIEPQELLRKSVRNCVLRVNLPHPCPSPRSG